MEQKDILSKLEDISGQLDSVMEDHTVLTLPRAIERIKENLDDLLNEVEDSIKESEESKKDE
jgi:hypothetical protein